MKAAARRWMRGRWWGTALCVILAVFSSLAFGASARAITMSDTWSRQSLVSPDWSAAGNREGVRHRVPSRAS
jgi:hypothetical protein